MKVSVIYSNVALEQLKKLDAVVAKRIAIKIADNTSQNDPLLRAKPLYGNLSGMYRYRIGDYRAIFMLDGKGKLILLTILSIKHRKDVYR